MLRGELGQLLEVEGRVGVEEELQPEKEVEVEEQLLPLEQEQQQRELVQELQL